MKVLRIYDLAQAVVDVGNQLDAMPHGQCTDLVLCSAELADELLGSLVDYGVPVDELPLDDRYALVEIANKIVRDALAHVEDKHQPMPLELK